MASRAKDWFGQGERDLEHARNSYETAYHEWACFGAQQVAEKAVKALFQSRAPHSHINSVQTLLETLPGHARVDAELIECAEILDRLYVATRYPHRFDAGKPADYYTQKHSEEAIDCAETILRFCKDQLCGEVISQ